MPDTLVVIDTHTERAATLIERSSDSFVIAFTGPAKTDDRFFKLYPDGTWEEIK